MFTTLFQIPVDIAAGGLPDASQTEGMINTLKIYGAIGVVIALVIVVIAIILTIISYFNIYHWGMTDQSVFEQSGQKKKKWFSIIFILPLIASLVNIIPILGQIASLIIFIYWMVMMLVYFFKVRKIGV